MTLIAHSTTWRREPGPSPKTCDERAIPTYTPRSTTVITATSEPQVMASTTRTDSVPKLNTRVRFPSSAPHQRPRSAGFSSFPGPCQAGRVGLRPARDFGKGLNDVCPVTSTTVRITCSRPARGRGRPRAGPRPHPSGAQRPRLQRRCRGNGPGPREGGRPAGQAARGCNPAETPTSSCIRATASVTTWEITTTRWVPAPLAYAKPSWTTCYGLARFSPIPHRPGA